MNARVFVIPAILGLTLLLGILAGAYIARMEYEPIESLLIQWLEAKVKCESTLQPNVECVWAAPGGGE